MGEMLKVLRAIVALSAGCVWMALHVVGAIIEAFVDIGKYGHQLFKGRKGLTTHGDADWATDKELKKADRLKPGPFLLMFTESGKAVYGRRNRGSIVIGGPGQGKSQIYLGHIRSKQYLDYNRRQHLFIHDISGELWQHGKPMLEAAGYVCEKIDYVRPENGIRYDVQSFLDFNSIHYKESLKALTHGLVPPEPGSRQPHFVDFARIMLEDVITLNQFEGGKRNLPECVEELMSEKKREGLFKRMKALPHDFRAMEIFSRMKGDEGIGMESTTLRKLDVWTIDAIREVSKVERTMEKPCGWSFDEMLNDPRPCALFVRTGLAPGGGDFARAVYMNLVNTMRRNWDHTELEHPRGVQALLDEFARLGVCPSVMDGHNELRKTGFSQMIGALSFAALEELYGKGAKTLFNGSDHAILTGNQDMEVNEMYSRMIGDMTIESGSTSETSYGESKGKNEQGIRRIKADQIRRGGENVAFAVIGSLNVKGRPVFYMKKGKPVSRFNASRWALLPRLGG